MEIEITSLLETDLFPFSHSRMEGGQYAGTNTWKNALAGPRPLLSTPEEIQALKDWVADFGAWDEDERNAWTENEAQALFLQFIAGEVRVTGADSLEDMDWEAYEEGCEAGQYASYLFRAEDGKIYFSLSH